MLVNSKLTLVILRCFTCALLLSLSAYTRAESCEKPWPAWEAFKKSSITEDGRVEDRGEDGTHTTSEGQSYALFFSLVANDRATFDKILNWTEKNLAQDDLATRLPSWLQGNKDDDTQGVLDTNSASDSDLWIAYTLGEAGRLWTNRRYVALASLMANHILGSETLDVPELGRVLLPGVTGFTPTPTSVRLNPSYVPMQLMRWFVAHSHDDRWTSLATSSQQLIVKSSPKGFAPDWTIYDYSRGFLPDNDPEKGPVGSYNAIRVYLWAGMLNRDTSDRSVLLDALRPMARLVDKLGYTPESVNIVTGEAKNQGPNGFSASMVPFLEASGMSEAATAQLKRIEADPISTDSYYNQVLALFALGWKNKLYQFDYKGNLAPSWKSTCQ
jgi:endo-1,4-beta-D-glucanase Y